MNMQQINEFRASHNLKPLTTVDNRDARIIAMQTLLDDAYALIERQRAERHDAIDKKVAAERERIRALAEDVRDAEEAESQCRLLTVRQEQAWLALMAGLEAQ